MIHVDIYFQRVVWSDYLYNISWFPEYGGINEVSKDLHRDSEYF